MFMPSSSHDALAHASRERLIHALYEAAELEHNLMCTYLYAAFSLRSGEQEGLTAIEAEAVSRWRQEIIAVAIDEMSHLAAVCNITSALGGTPRFGRTNFPLDPGYLPAGVVVKLAPFNESVLQHFIHLERPGDSLEPDGAGFAPELHFVRGSSPTLRAPLTPMGIDYATVGEFYATLGAGLRGLVERVGESAAFCGDPALQLSEAELDLPGAHRVICLKSALAALDAIVVQGEGAPEHATGSHFDRFCIIRAEYASLKSANPAFTPSHPAATNPVLRRPPRPEGRVWIEAADTAATVDIANAAYGLMLRLLAYAYAIAAPHPHKALSLDLGIGLMQAMTPLAERAARLHAGPSSPGCNGGMSFTNLRDASPLPVGVSAQRFFVERLRELADACALLAATGDPRVSKAARLLESLAKRAALGMDPSLAVVAIAVAPSASASAPSVTAAEIKIPVHSAESSIESVEGESLTLMFDGKRCIHARFCVTGAPTVFLANVQGPWLHPDTVSTEHLIAVAHECPSGAITYRRKDGGVNEAPPPVNLAAVREAGPYAFRGPLQIEGVAIGYRATLCRCGASANKPFCDGSHHAAGFAASGEPPTGDSVAALPSRDGALQIDPQIDGPLQVRGNLEITSGTGRVVARVTSTRLCRCGASATKPFCDGSHARVGFRS
jgi:CDGSH-type Zn-finger protein/uncharacterized Fe-S cluster protein YjdI